jgi:sodium-dependent dicarboxylate transporter 2/3/5
MAERPSDVAPGFERMRRSVGLFLAPLVFVLVLVLPTDLELPAHRLAAVFAFVIVLWITEAIPLAATALLGAALTVPLGVATAREAFAQFGHPIIFLFLGSFLISMAMAVHGLDRRIALFVLSRSWVGDHPGRILLAFGGIGAFLSMWMSNTATTAMMLPIGIGVLRTLSNGRGDSADADDTDTDTNASDDDTTGPGHGGGYATGLLLMIAFSCNVGGIATPVGSPPNLIAIGLIERVAGRSIGFFEWMSFGLPIAVVLFAFLFLIVRAWFVDPRDRVEGAIESIRRERARLGRWTAGEKVALTAFLTAVVLWTLPGFVSVALPKGSPFAVLVKQALPEAVSAILAASLLFFLPTNWKQRRFALTWKQAARIDWGTILLFGGGLALGTMAFDTGLAAALGGRIELIAGTMPLWLVVLLAVSVGDTMTEIMSNTATANLLIPIFLAIAAAGATGGFGATGALLPAVAATLGCSLAFCLPVATPPNAIVYGTGRVPLTKMIRTGIALDVGCALLTWVGLLVYSRLAGF